MPEGNTRTVTVCRLVTMRQTIERQRNKNYNLRYRIKITESLLKLVLTAHKKKAKIAPLIERIEKHLSKSKI